MKPNSSSIIPRAQNNTTEVELVASVDARVVNQNYGNTYTADNGGKIEIHTGAHITINSQNPPPDEDEEELPPLPRCPASCTGYVRRKALEDHMSSYFFQGPVDGGRQRKCYVLHGLGGSGKTQGALNFIDEHVYSLGLEQRRFSEAYWVDATTVETITKSLEDIALSAGRTKVEDALALLADHSSESNWIMLYNNADDPSLDLTKYFPKCTHGNIIVTTRNHQASRYGLGLGSDYTVSGMAPDEAQELFINQARLFDTRSGTMQVVDQLIQELGYFPLSVRQSGAYIFATSCTPAEYLDKFRTQRKQLLRKHNKVNAEDYQYGTVEATISLSFGKLSPEAQRLLQLFAWLHREYILEKIFEDGFLGLWWYKRYYRRLATKDEKKTIASLNQFRENLISGGRWDMDKFRGLLTELKSFSLATSTPEQQTCSIHLLVQEWTRSAVDKTTQRMLWRSTVLILSSAIKINPAKVTEELSFLRALAPHVDEIMKEREIFHGCSNEFGGVYRQVGRWGDEKNLREGYNERCQKILGQKNVKSLTSKNELAMTYYHQGNYSKAAEMQSEVMEICKVKFGADHPNTLTSMSNLALTYSDQGNYSKAAEMQSEVFEIWKVKLGVDHPSTLTSMNNLALTYSYQGNYSKAAEMQSEELEIRKVKLGIDHPLTLISMNNLALTYSHQGNYSKAAEVQTEVFEIQKAKLGIDHPNTLTSMNNLASTYSDQGNYSKAAEMQTEVFEIQKVKLGVDHPDTLTSMSNLALTYSYQGNYSKAAEMQTEVFEIRKVKLGVDHPNTLDSMNNLAGTYYSQGNYSKAAKMQTEELEIRKVKFGFDHPNTLDSMNNLAGTYYSQGNYSKAAEMQSKVLEIRRVKFGVDHPNTLISMNNLACTYYDLKDLNKTVELFLQLIELQKARFGADHSETQESIQKLRYVLAQFKPPR